jgi:hypothetical protein
LASLPRNVPAVVMIKIGWRFERDLADCLFSYFCEYFYKVQIRIAAIFYPTTYDCVETRTSAGMCTDDAIQRFDTTDGFSASL